MSTDNSLSLSRLGHQVKSNESMVSMDELVHIRTRGIDLTNGHKCVVHSGK